MQGKKIDVRFRFRQVLNLFPHISAKPKFIEILMNFHRKIVTLAKPNSNLFIFAQRLFELKVR